MLLKKFKKHCHIMAWKVNQLWQTLLNNRQSFVISGLEVSQKSIAIDFNTFCSDMAYVVTHSSGLGDLHI